MKMIIITTAVLFAMLSVAAADLPVNKDAARAAARSAPARPGALGPEGRGGGRVAPERPFGGEATGGGPALSPEQPERPTAEGAGANSAEGSAHGGEREAGGGGSPEHNLQRPAGGQAGATVGGEGPTSEEAEWYGVTVLTSIRTCYGSQRVGGEVKGSAARGRSREDSFCLPQ